MALTKAFKSTVLARAVNDSAFREALFQEAVSLMLTGDMDTGKAILKDYIHATVGFETLAAETNKNSKSLLRMFGPKGNPNARNLFDIIKILQEKEGLYLEIHMSKEGNF